MKAIFFTCAFTLILICFTLTSCTPRQNISCAMINNQSKKIKLVNTDSLCKRISNLGMDSATLFFYIGDSLAKNYEMENQANTLMNTYLFKKSVVIFVDFKSKIFTTVYNKYLKSDKELVNRETFGRGVYDLLKNESPDNFVIKCIQLFTDVFLRSW